MACLAAFAALCPAVALAVPAPAGALIESQAVVSYFNTELGIYESVSTNVVVTRVNSVKAIEVVSDQTVFMAPASVGQFAFFIRNTGNAPLSPSATLEQVAGHHANLVDIRAVIDQNRNGTADPGEWELTPDMAIELPVGGELPVIVQFATPASSHDGQLAALRLSAKDGSVADAATGTVIMSSTGLVLEKSATENEVQAGGRLRYGLRLRNNGANAVAAYAQLDGSSILIDGAAASGILVRDARPLNTRVVNAESAAGFVGLYHVAGQPTHTYVTTLPQDPSAVDAVAFFRAGDYPGGFSANLAFEVAVAGNAQEGFILNEASTWQQSGEDLVEVRSNLVRTPVEGGEAALTYAAPDGRPISTAALNSNVRLHLSAAACNTTPGADSVRIRIATDPEADLETAVATETGPNTGLFTTALIPIQRVLPVVQGDSVVSGDRNTKVSASATCGGQTVSAILTVNPGGFVFHSASNVAIPGATVILYDASGAEIERIVSDADGFYVVSAAQNAGAYRIEVLPPEGFSFPSDRKVFPALGRNVEGSSAFGEVSVSIGSASRADGDESVSIGLANNARLVGFEGNDRIKGGQTSVSLGAFNQSPGIEAIAIGARNEANADRSIAIGSSAKTKAADPAQADGGARDAVAIGTDALANDDRSISIGWNSSTSLNDSISIGTRATSGSAGDIMIGTGSGTGSTSGQNNVALGVAASQKVKGSSNIAIGDSAGGYREGDNNVAIGTNAGIQFSESEHETAVRADLVVSDAVSIGNEALASADEAIAIGTGAVASGLKSISIGVGNTVSGASSGAIGDPTDITGTGSYSLGNDNTIAADNAGTFGNDNTLADAADGSRVIGNGNNIDVSDAFVLGNGADVTEVGGVALGSGSVSDTGADVAGYVPGGASTADQNAIEATQSTRGAVAVGNPDAETGVYRQITGVAAGTADSDAANVAQLKSVETIAKTGWKLTTDSGSIDGIGPGDELVLKGGDGNIVISNQILSNDVSINLADEIEVNRVTARDPDTGASTVLDENGLSFTTQDANGEDTALGPRVTAAGIQAAGKITNVAAGEADTDAVNFSQLRQVETASGNTDQRAVKYDWTDANTNGVIDEGELNLDSVTLAGGMGGTRISNLAPGALSAASTDAVNGSQLFGLRSRVSNVAVALGGGAAYDPVKDEWIAPKYTIGGTDYSNVGDALAAVGGTAGAGWSLSAQGANASNVAPGETVDLRSGDGNIVVSKAETGDTVSFDLADDLDVSESITVGADPADPNAPTTVITGGSIVIGSTMLGSNGLVITGGPSVTTDGIDAGGMKVTNVANGTVAKDSKDAVNGGQLFDVVANATANGVGYDDKSKGTLTLEGANGTKITNVAAGDLNANSTDAVNGSQLYATNVKVDRLDTEVKEIDSRVTYIESFQGDLENAAVYDTDAAGKRLNTLTLEGGDPNKPALIANVAKGVKATDAVNVGQLDESVAESKSYTDEKTEWAIDQAAIYTDQVIETKVSAVNNYAQQRFAQLSGEIGQVRGEARQAAAIGLAAASLRFDNEPGKLSVALGGGFWRSEGALAFGAGYTSEDGRVRANLTGAAAGGNVGVGAGLSITLN